MLAGMFCLVVVLPGMFCLVVVLLQTMPAKTSAEYKRKAALQRARAVCNELPEEERFEVRARCTACGPSAANNCCYRLQNIMLSLVLMVQILNVYMDNAMPAKSQGDVRKHTIVKNCILCGGPANCQLQSLVKSRRPYACNPCCSSIAHAKASCHAPYVCHGACMQVVVLHAPHVCSALPACKCCMQAVCMPRCVLCCLCTVASATKL
jgi:hypothetical protein